MPTLTEQLANASTFVEAACVVCDEAQRVGASQCVIVMHRVNGPAVLAIDNSAGMSDGDRRYILTPHYWDHNRWVAAMRAQLRALRVDNDFATPILGSSGWCALVTFSLPGHCDAAIERALAMVAMHLSVWCTQHGIAAVPELGMDVLGPRQHRIAELAAQGQTNAEIAETLAISINTVKTRLKEVFERLDVQNRTELANAVRRLAPLQNVPSGISRYKTVTITCAERSTTRTRSWEKVRAVG